MKKLNALVDSLEKKADEAEKKANEVEKKYIESEKVSEERLKKAEEAESKVEQLKDTLQRLEEKLSNIESEDKVLRQQALAKSPMRTFSEHIRTTVSQNMENGHHQHNEPTIVKVSVASSEVSEVPVSKEHTQIENLNKPPKPLNDRHESIDTLIKSVSQDIGFSQGRPVAACIIYKTLYHWRSFEAERTSVFDRIIQMIGSAIENQENNDILAYWLSNTSILLFFLQRTLKATGAAGVTPQKRRTSSSLFGRMAQGFRSSPSAMSLAFAAGGMIGGLDSVRQVEAKYPALLFKQQLTAYVEKIYGIMRDNIKKDISALLGLCIQAPRTSRASMVKSSRMQKNPNEQAGPHSHWQSIVKTLTNLLQTMRGNYVPHVLIHKVFTQIFAFINVQLFNSLLLRRECCSFSNGEFVKAGLAELELWCYEAKEEYAGTAWDELKHIRQAVGFLVIHQKPKKSLDEIAHDLCPVLSIQQLYRICTMYWDDKYGTHSVSHNVIANMRALMTEDSNSTLGNSFLLDDDSSIPFSVDDISKSMPETDLLDINPPSQLVENPAFQFLLPSAE
uniref:Dilute domain-containing protein n=1 Tax=Araucaria cunninghamii TaxID=56994 RepID=A0A0D6QU19_ARACU